MTNKIKVLIVDDSSTVRVLFKDILDKDSQIEVVGTAIDPIFAKQKIARLNPDVITLDIEMPRMDGITFLKELMSTNPLPVVMVSSASKVGGQKALEAIRAGAVDFIPKHDNIGNNKLAEAAITLIDTVKAAYHADVKKLITRATNFKKVAPKLTADAIIPKSNFASKYKSSSKVIVLGASTGGTEAIAYITERLPVNAPPIVIVQHMPEHFTLSFAERLNSISQIKVVEAKNNEKIEQGKCIIAPGNFHSIISKKSSELTLEVREGPLVSRHRPSVDVLFRSAAQKVGSKAVGIILTGMGDDGSKGMLEMKNAGAYNIAQDQETSLVFGMPKQAIKTGAVDEVLPLEKIPAAIVKYSI